MCKCLIGLSIIYRGVFLIITIFFYFILCLIIIIIIIIIIVIIIIYIVRVQACSLSYFLCPVKLVIEEFILMFSPVRPRFASLFCG